MNTQFLTKSARQHKGKIAWTGVVAALLTLGAGVLEQRQTSSDNHAAAWVKMNVMEQRIEALELKAAYQQGLSDGLKQALTANKK